MAVFNAAQFLREAISSVLAQTYRDFELIVVDDASSDDSLSVLQSLGDARMRVIKHQENVGAALSRNDALVAARGEMIAIMDADDICAPTRLEQQMSFLDEHPHVGLVGCGIYDMMDASGTALCTSYLPEDNESIQLTLMKRWCFLHSSIMFRRPLYETIGGYRKAFEPAEDHDFVLRILEHTQAHNLHERLVSYRLNPKGLSVIGHQYMNELSAIAVLLAQRRRSGLLEDLDTEMSRVLELKQRRKAPGGFGGVLQTYRDSLYSANRYYGFGYQELCKGHSGRARRCFIQSIRTNGLFLKSWFALALSLMPFMFRSSAKDNKDPDRLDLSVNEDHSAIRCE